MIGASKIESPERLRVLLEAALKLLSQYARELNSLDNGMRKEYKGIEDWNKDGTSY